MLKFTAIIFACHQVKQHMQIQSMFKLYIVEPLIGECNLKLIIMIVNVIG